MPHAFSRRLGEGPLLFDGGMGTLLYGRGVAVDEWFDPLNLNRPALVAMGPRRLSRGRRRVRGNEHLGANRFKLAVHGLSGDVRDQPARREAGAGGARDSGAPSLVLGSVGPLGKYLAPLGTVTAEEARAAFREQAEALLEGGMDVFIVETFSDLTEITLAIEAIRAVTELPIVAQMAFTDEGVTFTGRSPAEVARTLRALGVAALGANCSVGSSVLYEVLEQMLPESGGIPLAIQPNAGLPSRIGERLMYLSSPGYMADWAGRMLQAGARIVGGCSAPRPSTWRRCATWWTGRRPRCAAKSGPRSASARGTSWRRRRCERRRRPPSWGASSTTASSSSPSSWIRPRGHTVKKLIQGAKLLKERGVEIVDINDGSLGRVRMAVLATAILVREATGSTSTCISPAAIGT